MDPLYNHKGLYCTVLRQSYIFANVNGVSTLVHLSCSHEDGSLPLPEISNNNNNNGICNKKLTDELENNVRQINFVWFEGKPFLFGELEEGTAVNFDAVFIPQKGFQAVLVWKGKKPFSLPLLLANQFLLVDTYCGLIILYITLSESGPIAHVSIDGNLNQVHFTYKVAYVNDLKVTSGEELSKVCSMANYKVVKANILKLVGCDSKPTYSYFCSCVMFDCSKTCSADEGLKDRKDGLVYKVDEWDCLVPVENISVIYFDVNFKYIKQDSEVQLLFTVGAKSMSLTQNEDTSQDEKGGGEGTAHIYSLKTENFGENWSILVLSYIDKEYEIANESSADCKLCPSDSPISISSRKWNQSKIVDLELQSPSLHTAATRIYRENFDKNYSLNTLYKGEELTPSSVLETNHTGNCDSINADGNQDSDITLNHTEASPLFTDQIIDASSELSQLQSEKLKYISNETSSIFSDKLKNVSNKDPKLTCNHLNVAKSDSFTTSQNICYGTTQLPSEYYETSLVLTDQMAKTYDTPQQLFGCQVVPTLQLKQDVCEVTSNLNANYKTTQLPLDQLEKSQHENFARCLSFIKVILKGSFSDIRNIENSFWENLSEIEWESVKHFFNTLCLQRETPFFIECGYGKLIVPNSSQGNYYMISNLSDKTLILRVSTTTAIYLKGKLMKHSDIKSCSEMRYDAVVFIETKDYKCVPLILYDEKPKDICQENAQFYFDVDGICRGENGDLLLVDIFLNGSSLSICAKKTKVFNSSGQLLQHSIASGSKIKLSLKKTLMSPITWEILLLIYFGPTILDKDICPDILPVEGITLETPYLLRNHMAVFSTHCNEVAAIETKLPDGSNFVVNISIETPAFYKNEWLRLADLNLMSNIYFDAIKSKDSLVIMLIWVAEKPSKFILGNQVKYFDVPGIITKCHKEKITCAVCINSCIEYIQTHLGKTIFDSCGIPYCPSIGDVLLLNIKREPEEESSKWVVLSASSASNISTMKDDIFKLFSNIVENPSVDVSQRVSSSDKSNSVKVLNVSTSAVPQHSPAETVHLQDLRKLVNNSSVMYLSCSLLMEGDKWAIVKAKNWNIALNKEDFKTNKEERTSTCGKFIKNESIHAYVVKLNAFVEFGSVAVTHRAIVAWSQSRSSVQEEVSAALHAYMKSESSFTSSEDIFIMLKNDTEICKSLPTELPGEKINLNVNSPSTNGSTEIFSRKKEILHPLSDDQSQVLNTEIASSIRKTATEVLHASPLQESPFNLETTQLKELLSKSPVVYLRCSLLVEGDNCAILSANGLNISLIKEDYKTVKHPFITSSSIFSTNDLIIHVYAVKLANVLQLGPLAVTHRAIVAWGEISNIIQRRVNMQLFISLKNQPFSCTEDVQNLDELLKNDHEIKMFLISKELCPDNVIRTMVITPTKENSPSFTTKEEKNYIFNSISKNINSLSTSLGSEKSGKLEICNSNNIGLHPTSNLTIDLSKLQKLLLNSAVFAVTCSLIVEGVECALFKSKSKKKRNILLLKEDFKTLKAENTSFSSNTFSKTKLLNVYIVKLVKNVPFGPLIITHRAIIAWYGSESSLKKDIYATLYNYCRNSLTSYTKNESIKTILKGDPKMNFFFTANPPPPVKTQLPQCSPADPPPVKTQLPQCSPADPPVKTQLPQYSPADPPVKTKLPQYSQANPPPLKTQLPQCSPADLPPVKTQLPQYSPADPPPVKAQLSQCSPSESSQKEGVTICHLLKSSTIINFNCSVLVDGLKCVIIKTKKLNIVLMKKDYLTVASTTTKVFKKGESISTYAIKLSKFIQLGSLIITHQAIFAWHGSKCCVEKKMNETFVSNLKCVTSLENWNCINALIKNDTRIKNFISKLMTPLPAAKPIASRLNELNKKNSLLSCSILVEGKDCVLLMAMESNILLLKKDFIESIKSKKVLPNSNVFKKRETINAYTVKLKTHIQLGPLKIKRMAIVAWRGSKSSLKVEIDKKLHMYFKISSPFTNYKIEEILKNDCQLQNHFVVRQPSPEDLLSKQASDSSCLVDFFCVMGEVCFYTVNGGIFEFKDKESKSKSASQYCYFNKNVFYINQQSLTSNSGIEFSSIMKLLSFNNVTLFAYVYECERTNWFNFEITYCAGLIWDSLEPNVPVQFPLTPAGFKECQGDVHKESKENNKNPKAVPNTSCASSKTTGIKPAAKVTGVKNTAQTHSKVPNPMVKVNAEEGTANKIGNTSLSREGTSEKDKSCDKMTTLNTPLPVVKVKSKKKKKKNKEKALPEKQLSEEESNLVSAPKISIAVPTPCAPVTKRKHSVEHEVYEIGVVTKLDIASGELRGANAVEVQFSRAKCFLYGISLYSFSLLDVMNNGIDVEYELDESGCVGEVWVGGGPQLNEELTYNEINKWCKKCDVPKGIMFKLLEKCGWVPPSCDPGPIDSSSKEIVSLP